MRIIEAIIYPDRTLVRPRYLPAGVPPLAGLAQAREEDEPPARASRGH